MSREKLQSLVEARKSNDKTESLSKNNSRQRMQKILKRKVQTSFIGALSQFEQTFGQLWLHGQSEEKCNEQQLQFRRLWDECRNEILNNGNNQIRAIENELKEYDIVWNRHTQVMPVVEVDS